MGRILKEGRVLCVDGSEAGRSRIEYADPDGGLSGAHEVLVEAGRSVMTLADSGTGPLEGVRQYRVGWLEKRPASRSRRI